jgi:hypothetical protein
MRLLWKLAEAAEWHDLPPKRFWSRLLSWFNRHYWRRI